MKILAWVDYDPQAERVNPQKIEDSAIFMKNIELVKVQSFFENTRVLSEKWKSLNTAQRDYISKLEVNSYEISQMGFVKRSELDAYLEKKISEIHNRIGILYYWDFYIVKPIGKKIGKLIFWFGKDKIIQTFKAK